MRLLCLSLRRLPVGSGTGDRLCSGRKPAELTDLAPLEAHCAATPSELAYCASLLSFPAANRTCLSQLHMPVRAAGHLPPSKLHLGGKEARQPLHRHRRHPPSRLPCQKVRGGCAACAARHGCITHPAQPLHCAAVCSGLHLVAELLQNVLPAALLCPPLCQKPILPAHRPQVSTRMLWLSSSPAAAPAPKSLPALWRPARCQAPAPAGRSA